MLRCAKIEACFVKSIFFPPNYLFKKTRQTRRRLLPQKFDTGDLTSCGLYPDWAIYWILGNFLKPLATISLPKSTTFLGNFCKGVNSYNFSSEIIFGQFL